ncbi:MAG TPA: hypothetical protein VL326_10375 [Kofleriaceae bacterium]|nr:hypothetical protein [Kofleriaceae bacterium]
MARSAAAVAIVLCGCRFAFDARRATDGGDALPPNESAFVIDAPICHTGAWSAPQIIAPTTTGSEESDPSISADELTLYFTSNRVPSMGRALWRATRASRADAFGTPALLGELDTAGDETEPSISPDELTLYYASDQSGMSEIYVATRASTADAFTVQGVLPINGDATALRGGAQITRDQLGLYYSRSTLQIAFASRATTTDTFTFVREISEVNSAPTDGNPTISSDGLELFFDSYRTGPAAVFTASRATAGDMFSAPTELTQLPMVTNGMAAGSPDLSADGRTLYYFVSTGQIDLYTVTRSCP